MACRSLCAEQFGDRGEAVAAGAQRVDDRRQRREGAAAVAAAVVHEDDRAGLDAPTMRL